MERPVPVYQIYRGNVFELIEQATSFVLSRIDIWVGTREYSLQVPTEYELPPTAVKEAIVNAILCKPLHNKSYVNLNIMSIPTAA